jgi:hypothetical protein
MLINVQQNMQPRALSSTGRLVEGGEEWGAFNYHRMSSATDSRSAISSSRPLVVPSCSSLRSCSRRTLRSMVSWPRPLRLSIS